MCNEANRVIEKNKINRCAMCMCNCVSLIMFHTITLSLENEDCDKCNSAGWRSHGPVTADIETQYVEMATWRHWGHGDTRRYGDIETRRH